MENVIVMPNNLYYIKKVQNCELNLFHKSDSQIYGECIKQRWTTKFDQSNKLYSKQGVVVKPFSVILESGEVVKKFTIGTELKYGIN